MNDQGEDVKGQNCSATNAISESHGRRGTFITESSAAMVARIPEKIASSSVKTATELLTESERNKLAVVRSNRNRGYLPTLREIDDLLAIIKKLGA